jgi:hypothetical protein
MAALAVVVVALASSVKELASSAKSKERPSVALEAAECCSSDATTAISAFGDSTSRDGTPISCATDTIARLDPALRREAYRSSIAEAEEEKEEEEVAGRKPCGSN